MKKNFFALLFFGILSLGPSSASADITEFPEKISQGSAAKLRLKGEWRSACLWEAVFLDKVYRFFAEGEDAVSLISAPVDQAPGNYKIILYLYGPAAVEKIEVTKKSFPARIVSFAPLSAADLARHTRENNKIKTATGMYFSFPEPASFVWPLDNGCEVTSPMGRRLDQKRRFIGWHFGVDCKAEKGTPVYSVAYGTVKIAEETLLGGKTIVIDHGFGIYSIYMHLAEIHVESWDWVRIGQMIGKTGKTGRASGPHLHFGIKVNGTDVDPIEFLKLGGVK